MTNLSGIEMIVHPWPFTFKRVWLGHCMFASIVVDTRAVALVILATTVTSGPIVLIVPSIQFRMSGLPVVSM